MLRRKMTAIEAELYGNEMRKEENVTKEVELAVVQSIMSSARFNRIGNKVFMVINPLYVHIPDWQRDLDTSNSVTISTGYVEEKWDIPKVFWNVKTQRLEVADGSHRIFGAQIGKFKDVLVYLMEISEEEAIRLFIAQSDDRRKMHPTDFYIPGLKLKTPKYVTLRDICHARHIKVTKKDDVIDSVGTIHGFKGCVDMAEHNPKLLENVLDTIIKMRWIGSSKEAFMAVNIRAIKKILSENANDISEIQKVLIANCSGAKYYEDNISVLKTEAQVYDWLATEINRHSELKLLKAA